jgi:hypothetical protein
MDLSSSPSSMWGYHGVPGNLFGQLINLLDPEKDGECCVFAISTGHTQGAASFVISKIVFLRMLPVLRTSHKQGWKMPTFLS